MDMKKVQINVDVLESENEDSDDEFVTTRREYEKMLLDFGLNHSIYKCKGELNVIYEDIKQIEEYLSYLHWNKDTILNDYISDIKRL